MVLIAATLGQGHVLWQVGAFFSSLAVVTFGGAYAVLAYMAQEAVQGFAWLQPGEMADGLGLAETTPGPLILVTQFVGYLAAFRAPEPFSPLVAGLLGAGLTTWVTFAPCFLWIFALAPWIDRLGQAVWLKGGLAAVTAALSQAEQAVRDSMTAKAEADRAAAAQQGSSGYTYYDPWSDPGDTWYDDEYETYDPWSDPGDSYDPWSDPGDDGYYY